jgi:predicted HicB family RNase H-like nuclease
MPEEKRDAPLGLRIRPSLKAKLERLAEAEGRSLANYVERLLEAHVDDVAPRSKKPKS